MKNLLMMQVGVRSAKKELVDGEEHTLYFKTKTPAEIAAYAGLERRVKDDKEGDVAREKNRAAFIASSLCDEAGVLLMTVEEAMLVPATLKPELCSMIMTGSNTAGELGKP